MRSFVIAAVMTGLVAGAGYVLAPAPGTGSALRAGAPAEPVASDEAASASDSAFEADEPAAAAGRSEAAAASSGTRTYYQWIDERGAVRFARTLEEVPPAWRERAGKVEVDASAFIPTPARRAARPARALPAAIDEEPRRARHDVTIYTAPWCGWCRKTIAFLDARGIDYVNKDIEADEDWAEELEQKTGGRGIPLVEIDGSRIHGYNPGEMAALLD
jgi:glutaredoxin